jgi:hypothetical protein
MTLEISEYPEYEGWYAAYRPRCEAVKIHVARLIAASTAGERSFEEAAAFLRDRRPTLDHRFCLMLYGSGADEDMLRDSGRAIGLSDDVAAEALEAARDAHRNARVMTILMVMLDHALNLPLLFLERDSNQPDEGPIRIRAPDAIWFESFCLLAQLAEAIVIVGNVGPNLVREARHLTDAGLRKRALVYAAGVLYSFEQGKSLEEQQSWSVADGQLADAIWFAAGRSGDGS